MTEGNYGPPPQGPGQQPGQYGQQPAGYGPPPGNAYGAPPPADRRGFGSAGLAVAAIGVIAVVLGFTAFNWLSGGTSHFSNMKDQVDLADKAGAAFAPSKLYFDWLGWVLLVAVVITAVLACLPIVASRVWQPVGLLVGLVGVAATFAAIMTVSGHHGPGYTQYLKHAQVGFYLAAGGFLVAGIGAAIGSRRHAAV